MKTITLKNVSIQFDTGNNHVPIQEQCENYINIINADIQGYYGNPQLIFEYNEKDIEIQEEI